MLIIPTDAPSLSIASPEKKTGADGTHSHEMSFEGVFFPDENLLGKENQGLAQTLQVLDGGRISLGALSVGITQAAMEETLSYAKERQAFGKLIADQ